MKPKSKASDRRRHPFHSKGCTVVSAGTGITTRGTLGAVNGTRGPNFVFQTDGNHAFTVPEPASLALIGLGLSLTGFFGKSRRRAG
jgi:hypothetical protein